MVSWLRMMMVRCCWTDTIHGYTLREYVCQLSQRHQNHRASPTNSAKLHIIRHSRQQSRATTTLFFILFYFIFTNTHTWTHLSHSHRMWICDAQADSVLKRAINNMFSSFCNSNAFTRIFCTCFLCHCAFSEQRLLLRTLSTIYILI